MLKKRLIPKFLLRDGRLVKYVHFFEKERMAGNPVTTAKVYNDYGVDELRDGGLIVGGGGGVGA